MDDQGVQSHQNFLMKIFSSHNRRKNMTIGALSSKIVDLKHFSDIRNKNGDVHYYFIAFN